jgi:hypothetical protein
MSPYVRIHIFKFQICNVKDTVVDQNKIGQSVTLDSFTIERFV